MNCKKDETVVYFFAVPIEEEEHPNVVSRIRMFQERSNRLADIVYAQNIEKYAVPTCQLHVTLCWFRVHSSKKLEVIECLMQSLMNVEQMMNDKRLNMITRSELKLHGVKLFGDKVAYVQCQGFDFQSLRDALLEECKKEGINEVLWSGQEYIPHVSLFKVDRGDVTQGLSKECFPKDSETFCLGHPNVNNIVLYRAFTREESICVNDLVPYHRILTVNMDTAWCKLAPDYCFSVKESQKLEAIAEDELTASR